MSEKPDFEIVDNVLKKYNGNDSVVSIPDGVERISYCAFEGCSLTGIILPSSIKGLFDNCIYHCDLDYIICLHMFHSLGERTKRVEALSAVGFAVALERGDYVSDSIYEEYYEYIKKHKKGMYGSAVKVAPLLRFMFSEKMIPTGDLQLLLDMAVAQNSSDEIKLILNTEAGKHKKKKGSGPTLTELKNNWNFKENEDGTITITKYKGFETDVKVPAKIGKHTVTGLANNIFNSVKQTLVSVSLPDGLRVIGERAFYNCPVLKTVHIPNTVVEIGKWAFSECKNIQEMIIPDGVVTIEEGAFENCTGLKQVKLPNELEIISEKLFSGCGELLQVSLPKNLRSIGICAFCNCKNLSELNMPKDIESIGQQAFYGCEKLNIDGMN